MTRPHDGSDQSDDQAIAGDTEEHLPPPSTEFVPAEASETRLDLGRVTEHSAPYRVPRSWDRRLAIVGLVLGFLATAAAAYLFVRVLSLEKENSTLAAELSDAQNSITELQGQQWSVEDFDALSSAFERLDSSVANVQSSIADLEEDVFGLAGASIGGDPLEDRISDLASRVSKLEAPDPFTPSHSDLSLLQSDVRSLQEDVSNICQTLTFQTELSIYC